MRVSLFIQLLTLVAACSGEEDREGPPHTCEGYLVEVRTGDLDDDALAIELNEGLFGAEAGMCLGEFVGRVTCGPRCSAGDWDRAAAAAEAERIRGYLETAHPDLLALESNPQVLDCACRVY